MGDTHQDDETGLAKDVNVVGQVGEMGQPGMAMVHELPPIRTLAFARFQWEEYKPMGYTHQDDENKLE